MKAKIYAVANQKGGVGKTTLAMNLAAGLNRRSRCIVVDADPQGSATLWSQVASGEPRFPVPVVSATTALQEDLKALAEHYDYVLVDCPPANDSGNVGIALDNTDVLLIPVLPSPMDLWASTRIEETYHLIQRRNPQIRAYLVVNQTDARNAMARGLEQALQELAVPALKSRLARRASYRSAALEGCSVYELGARGRAAVDEIEAIIDEVSVR